MNTQIIKLKSYGIILLLGILSCEQKNDQQLYILKKNQEIGIDFSNDLSYSDEFNVYKYRNYYNGGGVAIGDINNDGLVDIYLTANQKSNRLFLNLGNFTFQDVTQSSNVGGGKAWSTGVSMVDINADGWLDIYVCNSGDIDGDNKQNELFINQGDGTFKEEALRYNLADRGFSTHASFFDYDKDGDLDVYLLNNSYQAIGSFDLRRNERPKRDELGGDKLMQNNNGIFKDVSEEAGIYGSVIGFGLGVTVGDINRDGWDDLFISNDFFERDYLYLNQQDGKFDEVLTDQMRSISGASMGADLADLDNDGYSDIFVTEMLPIDYNRLKTVTTFEDWNKYQYNVKNGYGHQFTRNMLHRNNTNNTFSEVGRFAGVEASDWSWGALFYDMNNDGLRDLFIANGIFQDLTNQDYLQYVSNEEVIKSIVSNNKVDYERLIDIIPSEKVPNQAYLNQGSFIFSSFENSGLNLPSFSNGSAYGDLDNDGDLDLVVNNVNMEVFVFENKLDEQSVNGYIKLDLQGAKGNTQALGAKIQIETEDKTLFVENYPIRGFQSSMDPRINIGVGTSTISKLTVSWPTGGTTVIDTVSPNQTIRIVENQQTITELESLPQSGTQRFKSAGSLPVKHEENNFVDFHRERLTYHMCSNEGPGTSIGDVNNDGYPDMIIPGSKNNPTKLLLGSKTGWGKAQIPKAFDQVKRSESTESLLFDADKDGDLDLYLVSGGVEVTPYSDFIYDQLFFNDGEGNFKLSDQKLPNPANRISSGAVVAADVDNDGDQDLFVGERLKIGAYGLPGSGFLLLNDGKGNFSDVTQVNAPEFEELGLITDAVFLDLDQDNDQDLLVVGEFMGIEIFENTQGKFSRRSTNALSKEKGWWLKAHPVDLDQDGDVDLVLGNHGKNSRFRASNEFPIKMYLNDFDNNGSVEGVLTFSSPKDGRDFPYALRHNLIDQMKSLKKKFPDYASFRDADMKKIFSPAQMKNVQIQEVNNLSSVFLINQGNFQLDLIDLPQEAQLSPVYAINHLDVDQDGDMDLFLGGNLYKAKPEVGIYDASYGTFLENTGKATFQAYKDGKGFSVKGEIRDIEILQDKVYVFRNNDSIAIFKYE